MVKLPVNPKIMCEFKLSDWTLLDELIKRNEAMPVRKPETEGIENNKCPKCGELLLRRSLFCDICGQRIDQEHYAFYV